jgi:hypothetical protein
VVDVRIIGGGVTLFPGNVSSFEVASVAEETVSMSAGNLLQFFSTEPTENTFHVFSRMRIFLAVA